MPRDDSAKPPRVNAWIRFSHAWGPGLTTLGVLMMVETLLFYAMVLPLIDTDRIGTTDMLYRISPVIGAHALEIALIAGWILVIGVCCDLICDSDHVRAAWPKAVRRIRRWRRPYMLLLFTPALCMAIVLIAAHCSLLLTPAI